MMNKGIFLLNLILSVGKHYLTLYSHLTITSEVSLYQPITPQILENRMSVEQINILRKREPAQNKFVTACQEPKAFVNYKRYIYYIS